MADYDNRTPRRQADWAAHIGGEITNGLYQRNGFRFDGVETGTIVHHPLVRDRWDGDDDQGAESRAYSSLLETERQRERADRVRADVDAHLARHQIGRAHV